MHDEPDVLVYLEEQLDEATTILVRAADRRSALLDLTAAARSAITSSAFSG